MIFCERFEYEHACWDPKDGELCLSRAKPEETLVEARSDTDVQIVRQTREGAEVVAKPWARAQVKRPPVYILMVVANIQMRTLKTEVDKGSA
ncbi:hypothetical protein R1sor_006776 [Riccia sorocarpa]|uniref:Uncharacterized protein n=1 Tax=Riccia sorocarpa TaxID=122646 RepID=A0ABD3HSQ9_9MARC